VAYFSHPKVTVHEPAIHHKFTIEKPRSAIHFCQNPLQKHTQITPEKNPAYLRNQALRRT
jgi:hypothetical protein